MNELGNERGDIDLESFLKVSRNDLNDLNFNLG
jgi:hypothetical protein